MTKAERLRIERKKHEQYLKRFGASRAQIKDARKYLGRPDFTPELRQSTAIKTSDKIPENGTKETDTSKAEFCKKNYPMMPAYNKGPIMVVSKEEVKTAGKKL